MDTKPQPVLWWRHRRRHSYIALFSAVIETIALVAAWANGSDLAQAGALIWASFTFWGSVVGAYIGTAVIDDVKARSLGQHPEAR